MNRDFYIESEQTAKELLEEFGRPIKLYRVSGGSKNPVTGEVIQQETDISENTIGLKLRYTKEEIDGKNILTDDIKLLINASVKPLKSDIPMVDNERIGTILKINEVDPAGIPIVYFLQVRK